jgi:hypothetical protein
MSLFLRTEHVATKSLKGRSTRTKIEFKCLSVGRAVAQAVSRWLPTAATGVHVEAGCGACGGQSGTGAGFLRVLRFPLLIIISPISPSP